MVKNEIKKEIKRNDELVDNIMQVLADAERIYSKIKKFDLENGIIEPFLDFLEKTYKKRDNLLKTQQNLVKKFSNIKT
ncbi:MAG: hypothetical protein JSV62_07575 [Promethearchaeota archaeon]|nr:MAG: hypothetical protein JSV62_07575 [Candidatus Lokiarchaeota archaeon]